MWLITLPAFQRQQRRKYLQIFLLMIASSQIPVNLGFLLPHNVRVPTYQVVSNRFQDSRISIPGKPAVRQDVGRVPKIHAFPREAEQTSNVATIDNIERVFAISDLHTDNVSNFEWLRDLCSTQNMKNGIGPNDALIIAGDISHELSKLKETLCIIKEHLKCQIFFVWGNHEAWIFGQEMDSLGIETSLQKIGMVEELCRELGVHTECKLVGTSNENPVFILPIESWYDASLSLPQCEDLCADFKSWRWVDFIRCVWPDQDISPSTNGGLIDVHHDTISASKRLVALKNTGRIPLGLTEALERKNDKTIKLVQDHYMRIDGTTRDRNDAWTPPGLITFSHFLPNQICLPDWKDPKSDTFLRDEWLDHPVPGTSAKFAKVAGSILIDEQIRRIVPHDKDGLSKSMAKQLQSVQHLHVFGHSHRPKDFVYNNVRYVHNPLGKPAEREMNMVSKDVSFQLIWDCTKESFTRRNHILHKSDDNQTLSSVGIKAGTFGGEIPGTQIIRYWEEQGGGKEVLSRNMRNGRRRKRIQLKRSLRELKLSTQVEKTSKSKESNL